MATTAPIGGPIEHRIRNLANEVFDPADMAAAALTPVLKARSAAFLVLAHAEIEHALEQECLRTAGLLRVASEPVTAILAWGFTSLRPDRSVMKPKKKIPLDELVDLYVQVVNSNHGIRTHNLDALLVPLGVDLKSVKTDILALDEFGGRRGDLAHQPLSNWTTPDLPSVHVGSGVQAGRSADELITAIRAGHSRIIPAGVRRLHPRRKVARALRRIAATLDSN